MTDPGDEKAVLRASVVIVSRHRPGPLQHCLRALRQQDHPDFEVIVVADPATLASIHDTDIKTYVFDEPNISMARNRGIALASAEVVAFIDDDAVAEPTWLSRLTAPFSDPAVLAAGGFVRSRNGISFQWQGGRVDRFGRLLPLHLSGNTPVTLTAPSGQAIEVTGTNCAYRRAAIAALGGFDPAIRYYLDETSLNLRLSVAGASVAIVPMAQVHHFKAESPHRSATLVPRSFHDVGRSSAILMRRQMASAEEWHEVIRWLEADVRRRLNERMVRGDIEPRDVSRLLDTLQDGLAEGATAALIDIPALPHADDASFRRFAAQSGACISLSGRFWRAAPLRARAADRALSGDIVTLFLLSPTSFRHNMRYDFRGFWEQSGGIFGKAERSNATLQICGFRNRVEREKARVWQIRCRKPADAPAN